MTTPEHRIHWGGGGYMYQLTGTELGTQCAISVVADQAGVARDLAEHGWQLIAAIDVGWSRFREDSELSRFNTLSAQAASARQVQLNQKTADLGLATPPLRTPINSGFRLLLQAMITAYEVSGGLVDCAILPQLQHAGYDLDFASAHRQVSARPLPDRFTVGQLELGADYLEFPPGIQLDSGGVGKGLGADLIVSDLWGSDGISGVLVDLGGDIRAIGHDEYGLPWQVGIAHPRTDALIETVVGDSLAVATSSVSKRAWQGGHHLIDPRTGQPAQTDLLAVSVCTTSALHAEICTKTALLLPASQCISWLQSQALTGWWLVAHDGEVQGQPN